MLGVKTLDYNRLTGDDIRKGVNSIRTADGSFGITDECNYVGLKLSAKAKAIAWYGDEVVGMETADRRFTWITFSLATAFGPRGCEKVVRPLVQSFGIKAPVDHTGNRIIIHRAQSKLGGSLLFLFNPKRAKPSWSLNNRDFSTAQDPIEKRSLQVQQGRLACRVRPGAVKVLYLS